MNDCVIHRTLPCPFRYLWTIALATTLMISDAPLFASQSPQSQQTDSVVADNGSSSSLPDAPQAQADQTPQQPAQEPTGAAGAKAPTVKGAPVAQPFGAAVAPPRQHGHRSLLIKLGLIAGAGVAVGTVVALSVKSPARPPGTTAP